MSALKIRRVCSALLAVLLTCTLLISFAGCGYKPIESTEEQTRTVGKVGDYFVKYEELRYLTMTFRRQFELTYGEGIWESEDTAEQYRAELEAAVMSALTHDAAVQTLCRNMGFGIEDSAITEATYEYIASFVDKLGGMRKYKRYLEENYMTDGFMRQTIAIDYMINELRYVYIDTELISNNFNEIYDAIMNDEMFCRTKHIYISEQTDGAREKIDAAYEALENGADFVTVMKQYNEDDAVDPEAGTYFTYGEVDEYYEKVAYSLGYGAYSRVINTSGGYIIIERHKPDAQYVMLNYQDLVDRYQYAVLDMMISDCREELEFVPSDNYSEIDLTKMQ